MKPFIQRGYNIAGCVMVWFDDRTPVETEIVKDPNNLTDEVLEIYINYLAYGKSYGLLDATDIALMQSEKELKALLHCYRKERTNRLMGIHQFEELTNAQTNRLLHTYYNAHVEKLFEVKASVKLKKEFKG